MSTHANDIANLVHDHIRRRRTRLVNRMINRKSSFYLTAIFIKSSLAFFRNDRKKDKDESQSTDAANEESMSIEETNKLRAKLGLAPLEVEQKPKIRDSESGDPREKIVNEDGFEFVHKAPDNIAEKKRNDAVKEKLQVDIYI